MGTAGVRVARGVAWLVGKGFDLTTVDLETLDIGSEEGCVLAQLSGMLWMEACDEYELDRVEAARLGFLVDLYRGTSVAEWEADLIAVNAEWVQVLTEVRASTP